MTTNNIKELSEELAKLYGIDAWTKLITGCNYGSGENYEQLYLAEDSGSISDLADDNGIGIEFFKRQLRASNDLEHLKGGKDVVQIDEYYSDHPAKHDAARMARVRCLLAIGEDK